jgi:hypothetical protein
MRTQLFNRKNHRKNSGVTPLTFAQKTPTLGSTGGDSRTQLTAKRNYMVPLGFAQKFLTTKFI